MVSSKQLCEETAAAYVKRITGMINETKEDGQNMLEWYLDDSYSEFRELRVTVDIDDLRDISGFSLQLAYGGPNVYLTVEGNNVMVEVYWGDVHKEHINDKEICNLLWKWIYEMWGYKTGFEQE